VRFDIWWDLGCHFVQEWRLEDGKLIAASPLYKRNEPATRVEVAVGRFKDVIPVIEPYASAMPVAGELPDGRPWIVCNNQSRFDMYLTLSEDGRTFDQTWLLLHNTRGNTDGGMHKGGGPQYFQSVTVGGNIWVVYSIAKEQVGVTRIPLAMLPLPKNKEL